MPDDHDIGAILNDWPYQSGQVCARRIEADDGRPVLQMRIELGVLQLEVTGRPDGQRPRGHATYLDYLRDRAAEQGKDFSLTEDDAFEVDREFLQYYHRRLCALSLKDFRRALEDANHTLALMDFVLLRSGDRNWAMSHEQYRPFVIFHRSQAAAMVALEDAGPEPAVEAISDGLARMRAAFETIGETEAFDRDELVGQLREMQQALRKQYQIDRTLSEQLADAIASEQYELAAYLRDEIMRKSPRPEPPVV